MSATTLVQQLETRIRQEMPSLSSEQAEELADLVRQLIDQFQPECIYAFGSRARGDAQPDSDVDLMVVVAESDDPGYRRAQDARRSLQRRFLFSLDILVWTSDEFNQRSPNPATLPGTILREGRKLYAA
jgi:predicted nucleotidyltransferase